jgi:hypothetical protein
MVQFLVINRASEGFLSFDCDCCSVTAVNVHVTISFMLVQSAVKRCVSGDPVELSSRQDESSCATVDGFFEA